jgi:hypothetical protein
MRASIVSVLLLLTACGGTQYQRYAGVVPSAPEVTYQCIQTEMPKLGYRRLQYDASTLWFVGVREEQDQVPSGLYRKTIEKLDVKVTPENGASALAIEAHTIHEYSNQRGIDQQEQQATERVKRDAQLLARACSGAAGGQ